MKTIQKALLEQHAQLINEINEEEREQLLDIKMRYRRIRSKIDVQFGVDHSAPLESEPEKIDDGEMDVDVTVDR